MEKVDKIITIFLLVLSLVIGVIVWGEETDRIGFQCTKYDTIDDITSVYYRSATVATESGSYVLDQPDIKDGDKICIEGVRYNNITNTDTIWNRD